MQFPVPQFTDVEDKIIGPLTIKQFGIVFAAGIIVFLGFSVTKSVLVGIFLFVVFGIPALGLAFAKINGRPIYNSLGYFIKFFMSPRYLVFHKEAKFSGSQSQMKDAETKSKTPAAEVSPPNTQDNLRKVQELLRNTASREAEVVGSIRDQQNK